jgi:hypothetical protein
MYFGSCNSLARNMPLPPATSKNSFRRERIVGIFARHEGVEMSNLPETTIPDAHPGEEIGEFGEYIPSPEEIRRQCYEIRMSWSAAERRSRGCERNRRWEVPVAKYSSSARVGSARD